MGLDDIQNAKEKYACQSDFLSFGGIQAPHHTERKTEYQDVSQEIKHTASNGKIMQVDACCARNSSVPEGSHRSALKDG